MWSRVLPRCLQQWPPRGGAGPSLLGSWDHTSGGAERKRLLVSDRDHQVSVSHRVTRVSPPPTAVCPRPLTPPAPQHTAGTSRGSHSGEGAFLPGTGCGLGLLVARTSCKLRRPRVPAVCAPPRLGAHPPGAPPSWEHSFLCVISQAALTKPEVYLPASLNFRLRPLAPLHSLGPI